MTDQTVTASVGNGVFSRTFTDSATDGQWSNNILTDDVAQTNLGLVMPLRTINNVAVKYTAGSCIWRIQSSQSLLVKRYGYGVKEGNVCYESSMIPAYTVQPDDILTVYPLAVDTDPNESTVMGWIQTSRGFESFGAAGVLLTVPTEIKTLVNGQTIGDYAFNATLQGITLMAEDAGSISKVEIIDQVGGTIWTGYGSPRMPTAGGKNAQYNFKSMGMNIPILKGYAIKVTLA